MSENNQFINSIECCSTILPCNTGIQEKLGILNNGEVYAVFAYDSQQPDELSFDVNDRLTILRKGDDSEREWWWAKCAPGKEGYVPRNLLGVSLLIYSINFEMILIVCIL